MALMRAMESRRAGRLFDDPFAQRFVDAAPEAIPAASGQAQRPDQQGLLHDFARHAAARTRHFDDALLAATRDHAVRQVVLVAAGLDARAYRLDWPPGTTVYELDLPEVLDFKQGVLRDVVPKAHRRVVPADLTRSDWPDRLVAQGFDGVERTAWLVEGLLVYLTAEDATGLLQRIGDLSAPGSTLHIERASEERASEERASEERASDGGVLARARDLPAMKDVAKLWLGGMKEVPRWLAAHDWDVRVEHRGIHATRKGAVSRTGP